MVKVTTIGNVLCGGPLTTKDNLRLTETSLVIVSSEVRKGSLLLLSRKY